MFNPYLETEYITRILNEEEAADLARRILGEREMCDARQVDMENNRILRCRSSHYDDNLNEVVIHHDDVYGDWHD